MLEYIKKSNLKLERFPLVPNDRFRAWDTADDYIINHLNKRHDKYHKVLIIEDEFGAIGLNIQAQHLYYVNDSILSRKGIINNYALNSANLENVTFLSPFENFPSDIDLVILKIPKVNHYFEFLLNKLNTIYNSDTTFIAGSMIKYLNTAIYKLCQANLTEFMYSLSWKKAKIITGKLTGLSLDIDFRTILHEFDITLINYPNLFSSRKLDIGTRFLLENLANIDYPSNIENVIDVGSANGILGFKLLTHIPKCNLWLTDISFSAFSSASATIIENNLDTDKIHLITDNSLSAFADEFAEFIIINPPFHQNHKVTISASLLIFEECLRVLKKQGKLLVVANKHLGYQTHLAKIFSTVELINQNSKFMIFLAGK